MDPGCTTCTSMTMSEGCSQKNEAVMFAVRMEVRAARVSGLVDVMRMTSQRPRAQCCGFKRAVALTQWQITFWVYVCGGHVQQTCLNSPFVQMVQERHGAVRAGKLRFLAADGQSEI